MNSARCSGVSAIHRAAAAAATGAAASRRPGAGRPNSLRSAAIAARTLGRIGLGDLHVAGERHGLDHAAVLLQRQQLLVVHVAAVIGQRAGRRVRRDHRRLRQRQRLHVRRLRRMREVDHDPPLVHLGDHLLAELAEAVVQPLAVALAGVGVGELAVAVVRERHVAAAAIVELLHALDVGAERIGVLDADQRDLLARLRDARHVGRGQRQLDLSGRDLLRQVMHGVELRDRLLVGAVVAFGRQRALADVDDEERGVEAAFLHLRQVDLRVEALGVVLLPREVVRVDVVVRVERDHAIVNGARLLDERGIGGGLRGGRRGQRGRWPAGLRAMSGRTRVITTPAEPESYHCQTAKLCGPHPIAAGSGAIGDRKRPRHAAGGRAVRINVGAGNVGAGRQSRNRHHRARHRPAVGASVTAATAVNNGGSEGRPRDANAHRVGRADGTTSNSRYATTASPLARSTIGESGAAGVPGTGASIKSATRSRVVPPSLAGKTRSTLPCRPNRIDRRRAQGIAAFGHHRS